MDIAISIFYFYVVGTFHGGPVAQTLAIENPLSHHQNHQLSNWTLSATNHRVQYQQVLEKLQESAATFLYTGTVQTYTVPSGIDELIIQACGAMGTGRGGGGTGGYGGCITSTCAVTPLAVFYIYVGGSNGYKWRWGPQWAKWR